MPTRDQHKETPDPFPPMLDRRNRILIGDLYVYQPVNGLVHIQVAGGANAGESGAFDAHKLYQLLSDFYDQEF